MTQELELNGRVLSLEVTQKETNKIIQQLVESQKNHDRAIDRFLIKFNDHLTAEDDHEERLKEYRDKHEITLKDLSSAVKQLSTQLASMPGIHDNKTRELLNPIYNRIRNNEDHLAIHELDTKTALSKTEEKIKSELLTLGKLYAYITSFLVSIILVVCGYLYIDLKQSSDLNAQHILDNIREHDRQRNKRS